MEEKPKELHPLRRVGGKLVLWAILAGCLVGLLSLPTSRRPVLLITEVCAANARGLRDADGLCPDWIEIYNAGSEDYDLSGCSLTDDLSRPKRWQFPTGLRIGAGEYLIVFASAKDRRDPDAELHTNFRLDASGEPLALLARDGEILSSVVPKFPRTPSNQSYGLATESEDLEFAPVAGLYHFPTEELLETPWQQLGEPDGSWKPCSFPFGFEFEDFFKRTLRTDIRREMWKMWKMQPSILLRIPFEIVDPQGVDRLILRWCYDDAVVAWINGEIVAAGGVSIDSASDIQAEIKELRGDWEALRSQDVDISSAIAALRDGTNMLALRLFNENESPDLLLDLRLLAVREKPYDTSSYRFFGEPTPGRANTSGHLRPLPVVEMQPPPGVFHEPPQVRLSAGGPGMVRYSLNNLEADAQSAAYRGPFRVLGNRQLRARLQTPRGDLGPVSNGHYVVLGSTAQEFHSNLPVALVTVAGQDPIHWNSGEGSFALWELGEDDRARLARKPDVFSAAGVRTRGSSSFHRPKKTYAVELRDAGGKDSPHTLLGLGSDADWILYSSYNFDTTLIHNVFAYALARELGIWAPRTRFLELFLSFEDRPVERQDYRGLYVLIEKIEAGPQRLDLGWPDGMEDGGGWIIKQDFRGPDELGFELGAYWFAHCYPQEDRLTPQRRREILDYTQGVHDALYSDAYKDPESGYAAWLDVASWIDVHLLNELLKNKDANEYSTYMHRLAGPGEKLRAGPPWDFDRAMHFDNHDLGDDPPDITPVGWSRRWDFGWWKRLFSDPAFVDRYARRWLQLRQGRLNAPLLNELLDGLAAEIDEAAGRNFERWPELELGPQGWKGKLETMRSWLAERLAWVDSQLIAAPEVVGTPTEGAGPCVELRSRQGGEIYYCLDGSDPRSDDGRVSAHALLYSEKILLESDAELRARVRFGETVWGAEIQWSSPR